MRETTAAAVGGGVVEVGAVVGSVGVVAEDDPLDPQPALTARSTNTRAMKRFSFIP
jgi:hypothetical protein